MSRHTRAAIAGGAAAVAYYAASALRSQRPVRLGGLLVLSLGALAGTVAQGNRASAKAYEVEGRLNQFFNGGGQVGGNLVINGNHTVNGTHTVNGRANLQTINDNSGWVPAGNGISMSGTTLWLNGGTMFMQNGQIQTGGGQIIDKQGVVLQFPQEVRVAIGYQVGVASINNQAAVLAVRWAQLMADLLSFNTVAGALSHSDLVTLGFSSGDATAIAAIITQMGNLAGVYFGTMAQSPVFDYDLSFRAVRGTDVT